MMLPDIYVGTLEFFKPSPRAFMGLHFISGIPGCVQQNLKGRSTLIISVYVKDNIKMELNK
jgi:hypothetical protein